MVVKKVVTTIYYLRKDRPDREVIHQSSTLQEYAGFLRDIEYTEDDVRTVVVRFEF